MFTGIIQSRGRVHAIHPDPHGCMLVVHLGALADAPMRCGDSLAVNGVCLTMTEREGAHAHFAVSPETMACGVIAKWAVGDALNLEPAMTLQTPLGGHLVSGHVDGTAELLTRREAAACTDLEFATSRALGRFIAAKGSVCVDGVSLTTNLVNDDAARTRFTVMIVPHTMAHTTLGDLTPGMHAHLEVDQVARYLHRLTECTPVEGG